MNKKILIGGKLRVVYTGIKGGKYYKKNGRKYYIKNNKKVIKGGTLSKWSNHIITLINAKGVTVVTENNNNNNIHNKLNTLEQQGLKIHSVGLRRQTFKDQNDQNIVIENYLYFNAITKINPTTGKQYNHGWFGIKCKKNPETGVLTVNYSSIYETLRLLLSELRSNKKL